MRIAVVSGLYPPDFVGGATVQAQRLARKQRAAGHDVRVFAGYRGPGRAPLESWDTHDETGLPVTWLSTYPWFGFDDDRNYANADAEEAFGAWLEQHPADVVHLHALQGLGGGLVRVAGSRARVVVTWHDWWWRCARQFLVDRRLQPCCPVVDAGVCPCQVDRDWLRRRRDWLDAQLSHADLILAPSAAAAESFAANGADASKLEVDVNGVERPLPAPIARVRGPLLRFLYVGGPNDLKGPGILVEAAGKMLDTPGWTLDAYGLGEWLATSGASLDGLPVRVHEPFHPDAAHDVYANADVLVVPSLMRESYSLVTREALASGLPVVCTDSLGPEEAVVHEHNGLIVPSADAEALAAAMTRLATDRRLYEGVRDGCSAGRVRTVDEQAAGLLRTYERLISEPRRETGCTVRRVLFVCGAEGAPLRYRAWLPAEALALLGITSVVRYYTDPAISSDVDEAGAVVMYRVPATPFILGTIEQARARRIPVLFDVDDLVFDPDLGADIPALRLLPADEAGIWLEGVRRYRTTMEACDLFVGSTDTLCEHATATVGLPSVRFANGAGFRTARLSDAALARPRTPGPPRVAYLSGTNTHDLDWRMIEPAVVTALQEVPEAELWLVGHVPPTAAFGPRLRRLGFMSWESLPSLLRDVDVNLAPLEPGRFNEAKSAIKWLEAALSGTPTVASPTQPFREATANGVDGLLASNPDEWTDAIVRLLSDPAEAARLGSRARRNALHRWSPWLQARRYAEILDTAVRAARSGRRAPVRQQAAPLVRHDMPHVHVLEPYDLSLAYHSPAQHMPTQRLRAGGTIRWALPVDVTDVRRIDLLPSTYGRDGVAMRLRLLGRSGAEIAAADVPGSRVADGRWVPFDITPPPSTGRCTLEISLGDGSGSIALWTSADGSHEQSGSRRHGTPCMRVWREPREGGIAAEPPQTDTPARSLRSKWRFGLYVLRSAGYRELAHHVRLAARRRIRRR